MNNEQYLILSYFVVATMCVLLALATYALLRRSFANLFTTVPVGKLGIFFRKLFLLGLVFPALAGFFSVTFRSCSVSTYKQIIAERSYLIAKNQEQLGTSLLYICIALLVWGLLVSVVLVTLGKRDEESG